MSVVMRFLSAALFAGCAAVNAAVFADHGSGVNLGLAVFAGLLAIIFAGVGR